jgi:isoquinoline 1-oxidoreductase beta subunit
VAINRRTLLIAAGAGAGLVVGWAVWPRRAGIEWAAGKGETVINAFLKIGTDGRVTVAVPQAEMGQGVWSGLAQLAADELGADWRTVSVEPAPLGPEYANHAAVAGQTAELPGGIRGIAAWAGNTIVEFLEFQITGGSTSVVGFEMPLRNAGAAAREMLCRAAARRWDVDWQECDTRGGFVVHQAKRLRFAEIVDDVRASDTPSTPTLRTTPLLRGKPLLRIDIPSKTDGSARFGIDVRLPGMAYAAIEQGPIGATRKSIDSRALPAGARLVEGPDFVAVVANGWFAAKSALETLKIEYTMPDNPPGPWLEAATKAALDSDGDAVREEGDVAAAAGPGAITADYTLPFLAHACMEPMTATARLADGKCEVWVPTQSATLSTWAVAKALGIDDDDVTIYPTLLGGGFGRKVETDAAVQAAIIARAAGKPVQLIWSREEDFGHDMYRPAVAARFRGVATPAGITAWDAHVAVPDVNAHFAARNVPIAGGKPKTGAGAIEGSVELPYAIPNIRVAHSLAECNVPLGYWRSVGHSFSGFIVESFMDELAHAAGADPGAFRLALLKDKPRHAAVLRAALKAGGPLGMVNPGVSPGGSPGIGRGVALVESFGSIVAQVAEVELVAGGPPRVREVWAAVDCGRVVNPDTVRAQIEGGIIFGLTAALHGRTTFADGRAQQQNFDGYPLLTLADSPAISVTIIASDADPGGIGEPGTPPIAPAVANAIYAAGGGRRRDLPLVRV